MDKQIYELLKLIEDNGFEAYIIGGYVRDHIRGVNSTDIDISTNATPQELSEFLEGNLENNNYGSFKITTNKYNIDITTYRKELSYKDRHPKVEYTDNLLDDIKRRDFTINALVMNKEGSIIDTLGSIKDIQNKIIKSIGNPKEKFKEDPLRILRALRFKIILDFKIENNTLRAIKKHKKLIKELSLNRIKQELDKILVSENSVIGLKYLEKLGINKILGIKYKKLVKVEDLCGMYAQLNIKEQYPFTKNEKKNIFIIQKIIKYGKIDNATLFEYDLYYNLIAAQILNYTKESVLVMYDSLPIHSKKDIDLSSNDIISIVKEDKHKIKNIYDSIICEILNNRLANKKEYILKYINDFIGRF